MKKVDSFDGETYCPECGVLICAYCQGQDAYHHTRDERPAIHAASCSYLESKNKERPNE